MLLLASRDSWWFAECEAALLSQGIHADWLPHVSMADVAELDVASHHAEAAVVILSALLAEELSRQTIPTEEARVPIAWRPSFATGLCLALSILIFYGVSEGSDSRTDWHLQGVLQRQAVLREHQWWRLVTAATLHADGRHVLGNAAFLLVLGWGAAERLGSGVMLATWLITAVAGFAASIVAAQAEVSLGASGGLFGLLGAAAGAALWQVRGHYEPRRRRIQIVGAALMLLSFTALSPQADVQAHIGGFVAGVVLGLGLGWRRVLGLWTQRLLALMTVAAVLGAWTWAWHPSGLVDYLRLPFLAP